MRRILSHIPKSESRAGIFALSAAVALMALKFVAYFATDSAVIFSDAMESIVNVAGAAVALYALYVAHRPADLDHPYGHGKVEFLSGGFEGGMIVVAALVAAVKAVSDLIHGPSLHAGNIGIGLFLIAIALVVNGVLGGLLLRIGRRTGSAALEADGRHLISDAVTSVGAVAGLTAVRFTGRLWADPAAALLVAAYIGWVGFGLVRQSISGLMDRQDKQDEGLLRQILDSHIGSAAKEPRICSYHKLRHRHSGRYHWVDFHIMLPAHWNIQRGHEIASAIEYEIECALGVGNATAHIEPCDEDVCGLGLSSDAVHGSQPR